jgi:FixJ family two-component response regulator/GGDEF domain-containing protein
MPKARVLAVDDQRYFRELIEGLLTDEGYEAVTASSGEAALHVLEREDFDIVITDLVMPGIDGTQLVQRIKERLPDQEIVMVTGVVDVKSAVAAMKQGATDYILKPFDRKTLISSLDKILQRRRLREEHAHLMAENLEFMGVLSLYERAMGLFSTLAPEPLAERLVEGLCLETNAQAGVVWLVDEPGAARTRLVGLRGLIRIDEEPRELFLDRLPEEFAPLVDEKVSLIRPRDGLSAGAERRGDAALYVPLVHSGKVLGIARLSDKLEGDEFSDANRAAAEKFVSFGATAVANALRFRSLERHSFRDPSTKAYSHAYFDDVVRNEIQKASRFDRSFSIARVDCGALAGLPDFSSQHGLQAWVEILVASLSGVLRTTDLLAADGESRYSMLLPETDSIGAAILKQRLAEAVAESGALDAFGGARSAELTIAVATFPADGTQLEALDRTLERRIAEDRLSLLHSLDLIGRPFQKILRRLVREAEAGSHRLSLQLASFLMEEVVRRSGDRGLLVLSPPPGLVPVVEDGLQRLLALEQNTEVVVLGQLDQEKLGRRGLTWVEPESSASHEPFMLYYGEGPVYAMVLDKDPTPDGDQMLFHTGDRAVVEHLAFQLKRDLGIPLGA